eukprot:XP_019077550.1 PREDICTED: leucine-rich repeat receptor protein kinase EMS1-like [Vitis vinifera]
MEWFLSKHLMLVLIVLLQINGYKACLEEERMGLLEFKWFVKSNNEDADGLLRSWVDDRESDCCGWERVKCNSITGRVNELSLGNIRQIEESSSLIRIYTRIWSLNTSLFRPFQELTSLDLSRNWFKGCLETEGFEKLSSLKKLKILNLQDNQFDKTIIPSLGTLTSLRALTLRETNILEESSSPIKELANLRNLKMLDLGGIFCYHSDLDFMQDMQDMQGFERLSALKKLEILMLDSNCLNNSILPYLSTLTSLKNLSLSYNSLSGWFPPDELATLVNLEILDVSGNKFDAAQTVKGSENILKLKRLETLDLSDNSLNRSMLRVLSKLPSLRNLKLSDNGLQGPFPAEELGNFNNLEMLDLSANLFNASAPMQDSRRLSKLKKLKTLDLDANHFEVSIFQSLAVLPSLRNLMLSSNALEGPFPTKELANMSNLKILNLQDNQLSDVLPVQGLVVFNKLEVLDLGDNALIGSIPQFIWNLSSLQILSLRKNMLNSSLPSEGFCRMKKLKKLDLSWNRFDGMLPTCLSNLKSLRELDLSFNQFTGSVSSSLISNLTSLEYIHLGYNHFTGLFSFSSFANHSKLEVVALPSNDDNFEVETEYTTWVPKFQLKVLVLSRCNLNKLTGDIPKFLSHQAYLLQVDLSHNNLKGDLPNWMLENNRRLEYLDLRNNSFNGQFPLPSYPNMLLLSVDISKNNFSGLLQENFGEMLPCLEWLNLAENAFEGQIPPLICNISSLWFLDLSSNNFSGEVPAQLTVGCTNLYVLKLSDNRFHGPIFSTQFNLPLLQVLLLDNNQFTGTLSGLLNCSWLTFLDIRNNYFSGEIPKWMHGMTNLRTLIMGNNSFHGRIPHEFTDVQYVDLSYNSFTGSLPSFSHLGFVKHLHLQGNAFTGSIPKHVLNPEFLLTLDLGDNNISGKIPHSIGQFSELRVLSLRGNNFIGQIPNSLCQLSKMSILDLSNNRFSGPIPHCFNNMTFGKRGANEFYAFFQDLIFFFQRHYEYAVLQGPEPSSSMRGRNEDPYLQYDPQDEVGFITKSRYSIYKGDILNFMSGLDLSSNDLTGRIPYELGQLNSIHALNLWHNRLIGSIPKDFSKLHQLESLDLSYNSLSGEIPSQLTNLNFLAVFIVAHNNFSGRIPDMKAQFGTFDGSSYDGNPFLCGSMIERKCETVVDQPPTMLYDESEGKWYDIDPVVFSASFVASYITILLVFVALLYINPYWRRRWFYLIEECIYSCYYAASDMHYKLFALLYK